MNVMGNPYDSWPGSVANVLPLEYFNDIKPNLDVHDFVKGLLIEQSSGVIYGESNSGKTFFATTLALHVAAGIEWHGLRVEQGGVVYAVLEGGQGFRNRVSAWRDKYEAIEAPVHFAAIPSQINMLDPEADTPRLIAAVKAAAIKMGVAIKLIVIDTLARAMSGGNENAPDDMGLLVSNMDRIRQETGAMVLFIHHSGKDQAKGARGHSSLRAAIDTEIEVEAGDGTIRRATVVKQRETAKGAVFSFELEVVELGVNRHGEPVTTCLVKPSEGTASASREIRLNGHAKRALAALHDVLAASGATGYDGTPAGVPSVPEEWWRQRFYDRTADDGDAKQDTKRKAFIRAAGELQDARVVAINRGRAWCV